MFGSTNAKPATNNFSIDALMAVNRPPQTNCCAPKDFSRMVHHPTARSAAQLVYTTAPYNIPRPTLTNGPTAESTSPQQQSPRVIRSKKHNVSKKASSERRDSSCSSASSSLAGDGGGSEEPQQPKIAVSQQQEKSETPDTTTSDCGGDTNTLPAANGDGDGDEQSAHLGKAPATTASQRNGGGKIVRHNNQNGSGGGISPAQLNIGTSSCYELANVQCHLEMRELWQKFNELGTEMIITRSGRRMFPTIRVAFTGLDPKATYAIFMDIVPVDQKRYRYAYHKSSWLVAGKAEATPPSRLYAHPDGPMCGEQLRKQVISFEKIKLTNFTCDKNGHVVLHSMHRYQPRIHLVVVERGSQYMGGGHVLGGNPNSCGGGNSGHSGCASNAAVETLKTIGAIQQLQQQFDYKTFMFKETTFYSVTAYQNQLITKLKIDSNPFAKGFRDSTRIITDLDREPHSMMMSTMLMLGGADPFRMAQFGGGGGPAFPIPGMYPGILPPPGYPVSMFPPPSHHSAMAGCAPTFGGLPPIPPDHPLMATLLRRWLMLNNPPQLPQPPNNTAAIDSQQGNALPPRQTSTPPCMPQHQQQAFVAALAAVAAQQQNSAALHNNNNSGMFCDFSSPFQLVMRLQAAAAAAAAASASAPPPALSPLLPLTMDDSKSTLDRNTPTGFSQVKKTTSSSPSHLPSSFQPYDGPLKDANYQNPIASDIPTTTNSNAATSPPESPLLLSSKLSSATVDTLKRETVAESLLHKARIAIPIPMHAYGRFQ